MNINKMVCDHCKKVMSVNDTVKTDFVIVKAIYMFRGELDFCSLRCLSLYLKDYLAKI